ncbi:MAG: L,D-transpeptidase family protein [Actinomycetota bacterium]
MSRRFHVTTAALVALAALFLAVGAGAGTTRGPKLSLTWRAPTPADGTAFTVNAGEPYTLELSASSTQPQLVLIGKRKLPAGAVFTGAYGNPGVASLTWTPTAEQVGEHVLTFTAETHDLPHAYARPRSFIIYVQPSTPNGTNERFSLSGPNGLSRWAYIDRMVAARSRPSAGAKVITRIRPLTPELTDNLALALAGQINEKGEYWVQVRLPILPNGSIGWVPRNALGSFHRIWTRLVIDRALFTATLYRRGAAIFKTRVGVGKPYWPTPTGEFYVRNRLTGFTDPIYGPIAFGTNARSAVLTDWPGGGFIGIHGTNQPQILPGRVSHGCVRMPNRAIRRLSRLMPLGTPVTIT